jgi:hypothetical protein
LTALQPHCQANIRVLLKMLQHVSKALQQNLTAMQPHCQAKIRA